MKRISDEDFITAWLRHRSPDKVSQEIGINIRNVFARRNSIEKKHGIRLDTHDIGTRGRPKIEVPKIGFRAKLDGIKGCVMVASDLHAWPGERSVAFDAFVKLIPRLNPRVIVLNGDGFDGSRISRHPPGGWAKLPDVAEEIDALKERLAEIEHLAPEGCPLMWPAGNHDSRFGARLAQMAPEYVRVQGTDIADHFPAWQFCWSIWINEHTVVKHRNANGVHAAYNNVLKGGKNIVTGHTHRLQATQYADYNGLRWGVECGTLSAFGPENDKYAYAEDNAANWSEGFAILHFTETGMLMEPEFCRVLSGSAYFRGERIA